MKLRILIFCLTIPLMLSILESCDIFCLDSCCGQSFTATYFEVDGVDLFVDNQSPVKYDSINVIAQFAIKDIVQRVRRNSLFVNEAYGCSPPLPNSRDTLMDIRVIANSDFDSLHPTGANLNDILTIRTEFENEVQPLTEYLANNNMIPDELQWTQYIFNFSKAPTDTIQHSFTIEFVFDDKVVSSATDELTIIP